MRYLINKDNFDQFVHAVFRGFIRASHYNKDCFSLSEVLRASHVELLMETFVHDMQELGYSAEALVNPILSQYEIDWVIHDMAPGLKNQLDDEFELNMNDFMTSIDYCYSVSPALFKKEGGVFVR